MTNKPSGVSQPPPLFETIRLERRIALLEATHVFSVLEHTVLEEIATHMEEVCYPAHSLVVAEGESGNRLFVIAEGRAEVSLLHRETQEVVACLQKGNLFGEIALLKSGHLRTATVTAMTDLHLLSLENSIFDELVAANPELHRSLADLAEASVKVTFLKRSSPFTSLRSEKLRALTAKLKSVSVDVGTDIVRQGEPGEACYLLQSGQLHVLIQDGPQSERKVDTIYPGSIFGEAALLSEEPRNATVRATERSDLLILRREDLLEVLKDERQVRAQLMFLFRRRDRPLRVEEVVVHEQTTTDGDTLRIFKHPTEGTYTRVSPEGWFIWQRLDGRHTMKDLTLDFMKEYKTFAPDTISATVAQLTQAGFIKSRVLRPDVELEFLSVSWWQRSVELSRRLLEWCWVWRSADTLFSRVYRMGGYLLFTNPIQIVLAGVSVIGLGLFFVLGSRGSRHLNDLSGDPHVLLFLIPTLMGAVILHEMGHVLTVKHFGREIRGAGVGWYWFGPVAFVDTSDMWTADRWPRIAVSLAGPYTNVVLASSASIGAWFVPDQVVTAVLWQFALVSYLGVLLNLNPLLEYDGYYLLSDIVERPNLRMRSLQWIGNHLTAALRNPAELRRHWFELLYGLASVAFVAVMVVSIVVSYRIVLEGHLQVFLPGAIATGLPWALASLVVVSAGIVIIGELRSS